MIDFGLKNGVAYYIGRGFETDLHKHHALEFIFSIEGTFSIETTDKVFSDVTSVGIQPNVPHKFIGGDGVYLFVFIEPELKRCIQISDQLFDKDDVFIPNISGKIINTDSITLLNLNEIARVLSITIADEEDYQIFDQRIKNAIEIIKNYISEKNLSLAYVSDKVNLSEDRFRHLFSEQIGLPFGRYVLWCRLQKAIVLVSNKLNFTEAAYESGFADSAHLSRVFMEMFGIAPSRVLKKIA
ncbi:MAG: helix-turn-helix transcriptional regulator [Bacteroidia bacterium]|nr:helix-turn-helix transcriptional regulator [Bacteroidia bacterium]